MAFRVFFFFSLFLADDNACFEMFEHKHEVLKKGAKI